MAASIGSVVHVQTDTIRFMIPSPSYTWPESRFVYEATFLVGIRALKSGYDVILDGTFLKEDYRVEAETKLGRWYSVSIVVCIVCDREVARTRNLQRHARIPAESFNRLSDSFEKPKKGIVIHSDDQSIEAAAASVLRGLERRSGHKSMRASAGI